MPVASAMIAVHRDHLVLASSAQWPEIRSLTSQGQIVSADSLLLTDGETHNYKLS